MHLQTEVTIDRPRDEVFHRLADEFARTTPVICPLTISVMVDADKPIATDTTGKMTVQNLFHASIVDFSVTRFERNMRFSLEAHYRTRSARTDFLFRDAGIGTTVTIVSDAPARGPGWLQRWNYRVLERHERRDAQRLKALLEGTRGDVAPGIARRNRWRSILTFVLIGATLAVVLFVIRTVL